MRHKAAVINKADARASKKSSSRGTAAQRRSREAELGPNGLQIVSACYLRRVLPVQCDWRIYRNCIVDLSFKLALRLQNIHVYYIVLWKLRALSSKPSPKGLLHWIGDLQSSLHSLLFCICYSILCPSFHAHLAT